MSIRQFSNLIFYFTVSITFLSVAVVFAIHVVDALAVEVTLVEGGIIMELMDVGKGDERKTGFMFTGMNLHS